MARITDTKKLDRLKESTMRLVVENGFGGASASMIAKDAKIASGYFYLHYHGKYEMVNALLHDVYSEVIGKLEELIVKDSSFIEIIDLMMIHFFTMANTDPIKVKFLYVLTNDYSFVIDKEVRKTTFDFIQKIKDKGHEKNELDPNISTEDLYLILVINTIQFINQRFKTYPDGAELTNSEKDHLLYLIQKTLK